VPAEIVLSAENLTKSFGHREAVADVSFELYAGEVGAHHGVKLGDEVLVTAHGTRVLAPYPFSDALLA